MPDGKRHCAIVLTTDLQLRDRFAERYKFRKPRCFNTPPQTSSSARALGVPASWAALLA